MPVEQVVVGEPRLVTARSPTKNVTGTSSAAQIVTRGTPMAPIVRGEPRILTLRARARSATQRVPVRQLVTHGQAGARGANGVNAGGNIAPIYFAYGDAPGAVFTAPVNGLLTYARVSIKVGFNGTAPAIKVGTLASPEAVMPAAYNDPTAVADYELASDLALTAGQQIYLTITPGAGATAGSGILLLNFTPN